MVREELLGSADLIPELPLWLHACIAVYPFSCLQWGKRKPRFGLVDIIILPLAVSNPADLPGHTQGEGRMLGDLPCQKCPEGLLTGFASCLRRLG